MVTARHITPEQQAVVDRIRASAAEVHARGAAAAAIAPRTITPSRSARGARLVRGGMTLADAAATVGITSGSIAETYVRLYQERPPTTLSAAHAKRPRIFELALDGKGITAIAAELELSRSYVRRELRKADIQADDGRADRSCRCRVCGVEGHRTIRGQCSRSYLASLDVEAGMSITEAAAKHGICHQSVRNARRRR